MSTCELFVDSQLSYFFMAFDLDSISTREFFAYSEDPVVKTFAIMYQAPGKKAETLIGMFNSERELLLALRKSSKTHYGDFISVDGYLASESFHSPFKSGMYSCMQIFSSGRSFSKSDPPGYLNEINTEKFVRTYGPVKSYKKKVLVMSHELFTLQDACLIFWSTTRPPRKFLTRAEAEKIHSRTKL